MPEGAHMGRVPWGGGRLSWILKGFLSFFKTCIQCFWSCVLSVLHTAVN